MERKKAVALIILSSLSLSISSLIVKYLSDYSSYEKVFFRSFVSMIIVFIMLDKKKLILKYKWLVFKRCIYGNIGMIMYFTTLSYLPLENAIMLNKLAPFFVIIISFFVFKEKIKSYEIIAIFIAIVGAGLIIKPKLDTQTFFALIGLLGAVFAALAYITISRIKGKVDSLVLVFYFSLFGSIVSFVPSAIKGIKIPDIKTLIFILGIGVFGLIGQITLTKAYSLVQASKISVYTYLQILFSIILSFVVFKNVTDIVSIIGFGLIILAVIYNYYNFRGEKDE